MFLENFKMPERKKVELSFTTVEGKEYKLELYRDEYEIKIMNKELWGCEYVVLVAPTGEYGLFHERYECNDYKVIKIK